MQLIFSQPLKLFICKASFFARRTLKRWIKSLLPKAGRVWRSNGWSSMSYTQSHMFNLITEIRCVTKKNKWNFCNNTKLEQMHC